jgi:hypothetical protein
MKRKTDVMNQKDILLRCFLLISFFDLLVVIYLSSFLNQYV